MKYRDALVTKIGNKNIVITTDNSVSIGKQKHDLVNVDPELVGQLTARVALLEAISLNAKPLAVSCTLSFPFTNNIAQQILLGIKKEMSNYNLTKAQLTGSCESNFPATVTAIGVTVVSELRQNALMSKIQPNDRVFVIGMPLVGPEVVENLRVLPTANSVKSLLALDYVHEIIPCGSGGVNSELKQVTLNTGYRIELTDTRLNLHKSAGPASCLLVIGNINLHQINQVVKNQVSLIGYIKE